MKKVGLIVNPIAGMGGKIGLKGTDGYNYTELVNDFRARRISDEKCREALGELLDIRDSIEIITYGKTMGENILKDMGFKYALAGSFYDVNSSSLDTINAAKLISQRDVDILVFVGGDGTARNIYEAVGLDQVVIGVPSGVKMQSSVHGITARKAGELIKEFLTSSSGRTTEGEVMDIDETLYKDGKVFSKLYGYLRIPLSRKYVQNKKTGSLESEKYFQDAIACYIEDNMSDDFQYLIGPGSTTAQIMNRLGLKNTLLGVDLIYDKKLVKNDMNEEEILSAVKNRRTKLIITPTGGQGFLLGRGNQQISEAVALNLRKEDIIVISTKNKLLSFGSEPLLLDLGEDGNRHLSGYYKIVSGYDDFVVKKVGI